jgi:hypothetical protein
MVVGLLLPATPACGWDSESWKNPTRPTHTLMTEWAVKQLAKDYPEAEQFRKQLVAGANVEVHELPIACKQYGLDMNVNRESRYVGTNAGCKHPELIWEDSLKAHGEGNHELAYFLLGVLLHQVQDMGVPAHAYDIYHQGNATEFDNLEFMGLWNWKPDTENISKQDPCFKDPSAYYQFSRAWTREEAPGYASRDQFPKTWTFASRKERELLRRRQGGCCHVTKWALKSALDAFARQRTRDPDRSDDSGEEAG